MKQPATVPTWPDPNHECSSQSNCHLPVATQVRPQFFTPVPPGQTITLSYWHFTPTVIPSRPVSANQKSREHWNAKAITAQKLGNNSFTASVGTYIAKEETEATEMDNRKQIRSLTRNNMQTNDLNILKSVSLINIYHFSGSRRPRHLDLWTRELQGRCVKSENGM